jgi:hypothetical protein
VNDVKKAIISIGLLALFVVATDAYATAPAVGGGGGSCPSAVRAADSACSGSGVSGSAGSPTASGGVSTAGTDATANADQGTGVFTALVRACTPKVNACYKACQGADQVKCDPAAKKLKEAEDQLGNDKDASKDSKKSADQGMQMPQIPQQQQQQDAQQQQQQAIAAPASADQTDCTANPAGANCTQKKTDSTTNPATPASFAGGGGGSSGGGSPGGTNTSFNTGSSSPAAPATAAGGYPSGSSSSGGLGTASAQAKEPNPNTYADMGKDLTNVLNGERSGNGGGAGGGGGGFSYSTGAEGGLASYLPGGKNYKGGQAAAAQKRKPASMEVASVHENIFSMITKRFQILCKLREIRDCN